MPTLSKLSDECKKCPHVDDCDNKRMVACALKEWEPNTMAPATAPITMPLAQPMLRVECHITIDMGKYGRIDILREEIEKQLLNELYKNAFKLNCSLIG
jgi:hypothetical protein